MLNRFFLFLALTLSLSAFSSQGQAAQPREEVTVSAPVVTLGDVFEGVPDAVSDRVVATAPPPGRTLVLDAPALAGFARTYALDWSPTPTPTPSLTHVTVQRASQRFDAAALADAVAEALPSSALAASGTTTVKLDNALAEMNAPVGADVRLSILNLTLQPGAVGAQRFSALARLEKGGRTLAEAPLSGRLVTTLSVPVLTRPLRPGDVVTATDITWQDMDAAPGTEQFLFNVEDVLNKTPRRPVRAGVPLRGFDLAAPLVIKRGALVTLVYEKNRLHISTRGKAMTDGAVGETIRVVNLSSSRTVEGRVESADVVRVRAGESGASGSSPSPLSSVPDTGKGRTP